MKYLSTRGDTTPRGFSDILLEGLAPDGGLYLPTHYPKVDDATLTRWRGLSYADLAFEILSLYIDDIPAADLKALVHRTYTREVFGTDAPALVCEPGRGLCADAFSLITRVKAVRDGQAIFLNDGVYGGLAELPIVGNLDRVQVFTPEGELRDGEEAGRVIFGPTCDSVDRLPGELLMSADVQEGDYIVFAGAGAYSVVTNTRFNGFGEMTRATALRLD